MPTRGWRSRLRLAGNDSAFLKSALGFIDELAVSGDLLLENVLIVSLLERLAVDRGLAHEIGRQLGERARRMLNDVERDMFGRTTTK
jgi:hypothetical protein